MFSYDGELDKKKRVLLYLGYISTPTYYYKKNLQGDIIELLDESGARIAEYVYNAWGELITLRAANVANMLYAARNPFRYRGYYLDNESGFYFLQSRYYDSVVGRFINADDALFLGVSGSTTSYNLFAYCENDPVNHSDPTGHWIMRLVTGLVGAAVFGTIAYFICELFGLTGDLQKGVIAVFAAVGAALGAIFGPKILVNAFCKLKPWLKEMRRKTKIIKPKPSNPENLGGVVLLGVIKVMLHLPHLKNPYNPHKYLHLQIEFGHFKFRIPLGKKVK